MEDHKYRAWDMFQERMVKVNQIIFGIEIVDQVFDEPTSELIKVTGMDREFSVTLLGDEIILMQYTGLKDKKEQDIYEQDILEDIIGGLYLVYFEKGQVVKEIIGSSSGCFVGNIGDKSSLAYTFSPDSYKVVGDRYRDPELLPDKYRERQGEG